MASLREADGAVIAALRSKLVGQSTSLPEKYRILFSLRNVKGQEAHDALLTGAVLRHTARGSAPARPRRGQRAGSTASIGRRSPRRGRAAPGRCRRHARRASRPRRPAAFARLAALQDDSALFRHDVAFCMGQRQDPAAIQRLKHILNDPAEHPM
jgi:hypothetical protein